MAATIPAMSSETEIYPMDSQGRNVTDKGQGAVVVEAVVVTSLAHWEKNWWENQ